ncbi:MAG TPA: DMT family transporter [Acetobacteraceae bacterium]|nr:DMT family transporter [Acetobacteraceae bacterium]
MTATPLGGILFTVLAYFLFSLQDATIKWLVVALPPWQILFVRSVVVLLVCLGLGRRSLLRRAGATRLKRPLLARGALTLAAWLCYYTAAARLGLAQLITLYFAAPLIVTVLAVRMLGERITPARGVAVLLGFAGVVIAADPFGMSLSLPTGLVLLAAVLWATSIVLMRRIARDESSLLQMLYSNAFFLAGTGVMTALAWHVPDWRQGVLLLAVGVFGGLAQFCLLEGIGRSPAAVAASFEYTALIWAFVLGRVVFGDTPAPNVFAGAAAILAAGLLLVFSERRAARIGVAP